MPALEDRPVQALDDGGSIMAMTTGNSPRQMPVATIVDALAPALTALQPADVGSMAYADGTDHVSAETAALDFATIEARIAALEALDG